MALVHGDKYNLRFTPEDVKRRKNNNDEKSFTNESETNRNVYRLAFSSCGSQRIAALRP